MTTLIKLSRLFSGLLPLVATMAAVFVIIVLGQIIAGLLLYISSILLAIEHHITTQDYKERLAAAERLAERKKELQ